jgi:hypothetical protein
MNKLSNVGFEVLTVVVMKSTIFRDITPCSLLGVTSMNMNEMFSPAFSVDPPSPKSQILLNSNE